MKEPALIQRISKRNVSTLLLICTLVFPLATLTSYGKQGEADKKVDYASVQEDILRFENVVNAVINRTFSSSPFAVVQKAKGAYLEEYGVCFQFLINIHRAVINTPFGKIRRPGADMGPELKKQRIAELKQKLIQALLDNGDIFKQIRKEGYIAIVAHIEDRNIPDEPNANKTIVLSILKKDLDELGNTGDRLQEFKKRLKIVEY